MTIKSFFPKAIVAAVLLAALAQPASAQCSAGWTWWSAGVGGNDHCYKLTSGPFAWYAAESEAVSNNGHLASITSSAENSFLLSAFPGNHIVGGFDPYFTGNPATWLWTTGESFSFNAFCCGEPSIGYWGIYNEYENVLELLGTGSWNDIPTSYDQLYGIMETNEQSLAPEPSSIALLGTALVGLAITRRKRRA